MASKTVTVWSPVTGDLLLNATLLGQILGGDGTINTSIATAGNGTLTAAAITGGLITRTGPVAAYTDTIDTAAAIAAALGGFQAGQAFQVQIKNATAFVETVAAGAGITLPGSVLVPPFSVAAYLGTVGGTAAAPTVTLLHIDTNPINTRGEVAAPQALALTTVGAGTITAAGFAAGITTRGGTQVAAFADTTDTAAAIVAGMSALATTDGTSAEWTYVNNAVFPATLGGGTGVTIAGATVIPANSWAKYLVTRTSATAVALVCVGQGYFPKSGTVTANGATPVVVSDAAVTANSQITVTYKSGTPGATGAFVSASVPGTSFSIKSVAGDTAVYNYTIMG